MTLAISRTPKVFYFFCVVICIEQICSIYLYQQTKTIGTMGTEWTRKRKPQVLRQLEQANISPTSEAGKTIILLEKSANTVENMLRKATMESVVYSKAFGKIEDCLNDLNGNGYRVGKEKFSKEWGRFCEAAGIALDAESLDFCA